MSETSAVSSSIDIAILLIFVYLLGMGGLFLLIFQSLKKLTESIDTRKDSKAQVGSFSLSSLAFGILLYLFIRRISFIGSYITFILLGAILYTAIIILICSLIFKNRTLFRGLVPRINKNKVKFGQTTKILNIKRRLLTLFLLLLFLITPLVVSTVTIYTSEPVVVISIIPQEIYYENGGQIQDVTDLDLRIKAVQGYAYNININIEAPSSFFVWFDKIENGTKKIQYLEFDKLVSYPLQMQPSRVSENGTYTTHINWSYESPSGNLVKETKTITAYIGKTETELYTIPTVGIVIILVLITSVVIFSLLRKRK